MLKYTDTKITFAEVPTEINLCFSISNCLGTCKGCHSPQLRENIGKNLYDNIDSEIAKHRGITCVCLLGEGLKDPEAHQDLILLAIKLHWLYPHLKLALYSGRNEVEEEIYDHFDYVKIGAWDSSRGPINQPKTNQKMFKITNKIKEDITFMFWRKANEIQNN